VSTAKRITRKLTPFAPAPDERWFLAFGSLSGLGRRMGLWLCFGAVGADGLLCIGKEVGPEPVKPFAVIPPDDGGAERDPQDQSRGGGDESSGEPGVAAGVEVEDGARAGQDLAERLDLADELG
jgi:hypothetical protein